MKAKVYVALKRTVLDPQGKAIQAALHDLGYPAVEDVRQGKYFDITLAGGLNSDQARQEIERIARDVLTNPVIEEFSYRIED
jgi:phosphoribosylformylglycinamidine synthase subunit PurS